MPRHLDEFLKRLEQVTGVAPERVGDGWQGRCPAHGHRNNILAIRLTKDDSIETECRDCCTNLTITRALGLPFKSLFTDEVHARIIATLRADSLTAPSQYTKRATPVVTRLAQFQPRPVRWLWPGRVPLGKLTLLVGDPGLGKSFVTLDIAARISRGAPMPSLEDEVTPATPERPCSVVLLSAEDDAGDTIRPRLAAAGADLERIVVLKTVRLVDTQSEAAFLLTHDLDVLEGVIRSLDNCRLVVIDPITAYLGRSDSYKNAEIRGLLAPLAELASRTGVAVLAVSHLNKKERGPAIYRSMGSLAFVATARSVLAVFADPHQAEVRKLISLKNNVAAPVAGIGFQLQVVDDPSEDEPSEDGNNSPEPRTPVVDWSQSSVSMTAEESFQAAAHAFGFSPAIEEAAEWLQSVLAAGPQKAVDVKSQAKEDGIEPKALVRAKARLGVVAFREGFGPGGSWHWQLPKEKARSA